MILRIPEPEVMNDPLQVDAYAAADFSGTDQAMVERIATLLHSSGASFKPQARLLDLGCGPGNITARLAQRWPKCSVLGLDAADRMIAVADDRRRAVLALSGRALTLPLKTNLDPQLKGPEVPGLRQPDDLARLLVLDVRPLAVEDHSVPGPHAPEDR